MTFFNSLLPFSTSSLSFPTSALVLLVFEASNILFEFVQAIVHVGYVVLPRGGHFAFKSLPRLEAYLNLLPGFHKFADVKFVLAKICQIIIDTGLPGLEFILFETIEVITALVNIGFPRGELVFEMVQIVYTGIDCCPARGELSPESVDLIPLSINGRLPRIEFVCLKESS